MIGGDEKRLSYSPKDKGNVTKISHNVSHTIYLLCGLYFLAGYHDLSFNVSVH